VIRVAPVSAARMFAHLLLVLRGLAPGGYRIRLLVIPAMADRLGR